MATTARKTKPPEKAPPPKGGEIILIENTTKSPRGIFPPLRKDAQGPETVAPTRMLTPGINRVPRKEWEEMLKSQPMIRIAVDEGELVEHEVTRDLKALNIAKAKERIKATFDAKLLDDWAKDPRQQVRDAVKKQRDVLKRQVRKRGYEEATPEEGDGEDAE